MKISPLLRLQILIATLSAVGFLSARGAEITSIPLSPISTEEAGASLFTALATDVSGVDFTNPIDNNHPTKRLYLGAFACGGVAIGDLDGDGKYDLFLTSGPRRNRVYMNQGGLVFKDATADTGTAGGEEWTAGASLVDIDADGDLDAYVCNYDAPNALFINNGKGRFTERAADFGLAISDASLMASFCDYDRDGDLDCFLLTRDFKRDGGRPEKHPVIKTAEGFELEPGYERFYEIRNGGAKGGWTYINAGREDYLFRNDDGKFTDVSKAAGISGRDRGNSATWWDFNNDGMPDLYVGNDFKDPDRLYRNNGDGTFTDVIREIAPHTPWFSMGADTADLDGDGREDLLIADMAGTNHFRSKTTMGEIGAIRPFLLSAIPRQYMHNVLYLNQDVDRIVDAAYIAGLASSDWSWSVKLTDFDLDGRPDVFFTNGVSRSFNNSDVQRSLEDYIGKTEWDFYESHEPRKEENLAFVNRGGLHFENVSNAWGLDHLGMSYSAATGDLDGDGDAELVVASLDEPVQIYRNNAPAQSRRIVVKLKGAASNSGAFGATVTLRAGGNQQVRSLRPATGFVSCNAPELIFGLGEIDEVASLTVRWPRGNTETYSGLKSGQCYTITESEKVVPPKWQPRVKDRPMFAGLTSPSLNAIAPRERPFDDYARQPLLPYQHSLFGPGIAWGDVDDDGDQDLYQARPAGESGRIYTSESPGKFVYNTTKPFEDHTGSEDIVPLFFDADGDGKLDLYVVSGGVECEPGAVELRDRLYLGSGDGRFSNASVGALPDLRDSGSCLAANDFDGDGDLDLFVGSRVVPGSYPQTPSSRLLRNDSKPGAPKFTDVTALVKGLEKAGLVTAAIWADADGDKSADLLLACEWGTIRLFLNKAGSLVEKVDTGIADQLGWWSGIDAADLDGDGDTDFVVANQGLNTPYKASEEKPELLFYGDMDDTGKNQIIEAKFEGGTIYPRRGFSCSSGAMPGLRTKLKTFKTFASSTLSDLYSDARLGKAQRFEARNLATSVLINDGTGKFEMRPLPRMAQLAPSNCVLLKDLDEDGKIDCLLGQNFFGAQPEIGHLDSGLGLLLKGDGKGGFMEVPPVVSGIQVPGAAMSLTTADLNGDGRDEFVFGINGQPMRVFTLVPK